MLDGDSGVVVIRVVNVYVVVKNVSGLSVVYYKVSVLRNESGPEQCALCGEVKKTACRGRVGQQAAVRGRLCSS